MQSTACFHALTGCDTTSCFAGRGKRTAWASWNAFSSVTPALSSRLRLDSKGGVPEWADISTCRYSLPCDHQVWLHERLQRTVSVFKSQLGLHNAVQMRWMSAGCVNCLGILGVDLRGMHHYDVIKLLFEVTFPILENTYVTPLKLSHLITYILTSTSRL